MMMESTELTLRQSQLVSNFDEAARAARAMAQSGYFSDARDVAQAMVKILAGHEMGFGTFASMTGIHIIKGKPSIGANLMAAAVKAHPRYDYRMIEMGDSKVTIAFYQEGEKLGVSTFTLSDAKDAGLTKRDNWQRYTRNMLFARAISNGVRWYCPDVFSGNAVYTPDELDADEMPPDWEIVDAEIEDIATEPESESDSESEQESESGAESGPQHEPDPQPKTTKTRSGGQEYWHVYHNDGPKAAGVPMKYARNIAQKYGTDDGDWAKAISRLRDAELEQKEETSND